MVTEWSFAVLWSLFFYGNACVWKTGMPVRAKTTNPLARDPLVSEFWGAYCAGLKYEGTSSAEVGSSLWTVIYPAFFFFWVQALNMSSVMNRMNESKLTFILSQGRRVMQVRIHHQPWLSWKHSSTRASFCVGNAREIYFSEWVYCLHSGCLIFLAIRINCVSVITL